MYMTFDRHCGQQIGEVGGGGERWYSMRVTADYQEVDRKMGRHRANCEARLGHSWADLDIQDAGTLPLQLDLVRFIRTG